MIKANTVEYKVNFSFKNKKYSIPIIDNGDACNILEAFCYKHKVKKFSVNGYPFTYSDEYGYFISSVWI